MSSQLNVKRILIVHHNLLQDSGSCTYVRNLAIGFDQQGHHVTIACQDTHAETVEGITRKTEDVNFPDDDGITVFLPIHPHKGNQLPVIVDNPYEGYNAKVVTDMTLEEGDQHIEFVSKRLAALIQAHDYDFIFTNHCMFSPINVKRALEICGRDIPYTSKIHGSALNLNAAVDHRWLPIIYEGLREAKKIICGTEYVKKRLFEVLPERLPPVVTIPCGVNTSMFSGFSRVPLVKRKFRVVYVGAILDTKGIGELLLAMPHVRARHPGVEFHIIGTGTYVENLNGMVEALQDGYVTKFEANALKNDFVADHVDIKTEFKQVETDGFIKYHGFQTHNFLAPFLASCDVLVAPSKAPEAFGMVTIEAMAAGVYPVVADHSGLANVVDLISSYDSTLAKNMRIPFPDGKINIGEITEAVSAAVDFVKCNIGVDDRLKKVGEHFDWKRICEQIMH